METLNIDEFEAHAVAGEYRRVLDDGTEIIQDGDSTGYTEKVVPKEGWFYTYKEFYGNGNLKSKWESFKKGSFQAGIGLEFDDTGAKTSEIDYDQPYSMSIDEVLDVIKEYGVQFSLEDKFNRINRAVVDSNPTWFVQWRVEEDRVETLRINDATKKVFDRNFYVVLPHSEPHTLFIPYHHAWFIHVH